MIKSEICTGGNTAQASSDGGRCHLRSANTRHGGQRRDDGSFSLYGFLVWNGEMTYNVLSGTLSLNTIYLSILALACLIICGIQLLKPVNWGRTWKTYPIC